MYQIVAPISPIDLFFIQILLEETGMILELS